MKILIADSSPLVTERLMALMLEIPTVELLAPTSTAEATLDSVRTHNPEVVVMDPRVLNGKGEAILQALRREKPAIILIVQSNIVSPRHRDYYEAAGADLFMDKSNHFIHLYQFVSELVRDRSVKECGTHHNGIRRQLDRTKLKVGIQFGLFVFCATGFFVSP